MRGELEARDAHCIEGWGWLGKGGQGGAEIRNYSFSRSPITTQRKVLVPAVDAVIDIILSTSMPISVALTLRHTSAELTDSGRFWV